MTKRSVTAALAAAGMTLATGTAVAAKPTATDPAKATEACPLAVHWINKADVSVTLDVQGLGPQPLAPGKSLQVCADRPELGYGVQAAGWLYAATLQLRHGERRTVELRAPGGTVAIDNQTQEPQAVAIDGAPAVLLGVGAHKLLGPLSPGTHHLVARSQRSAWTWGQQVQLQAGQAVAITLPKPRGKLRLRNPLPESALLLVGTKAYGVVASHAELWLVGVAAGKHAVHWVGQDVGKQVDEFAVADDPEAQLSARIQVVVVNATGEDLELPAAMAAAATVLQAGASQTWTVPRAEFRIAATGRDSGLIYTFDVRKSGPAAVKWRMTRPVTTLRVVNRAGEPASLSVHGTAVATLAPGSRIGLRVPAGRLQVAATVASRAQPQRTGLMLAAHQQAVWVIQARETAITVQSLWPEPVDLRVNGRRVGTLFAHGDMRVPLPPGRHEVVVANFRLGWVERTEIVLHDGEIAKPVFAPPSAAAHLDNRKRKVGGELWVENVKGLQVAAGDQAGIAVPAGHTYVQARDIKGQRGANTEVWSAPTEQVAVPLPPHALVRLVVVSGADKPLQITLNSGEVRTLQPGDRWAAGELPVAVHLLTIDDGKRRTAAQVTLDGSRSEVHVMVRRAGGK